MIFFSFDKISKLWAWEPKMSCWVLSEVIFWPKWSFCNQALLRFFMHMKTHFSTISFYLNLQINNFFKMARLINESTESRDKMLYFIFLSFLWTFSISRLEIDKIIIEKLIYINPTVFVYITSVSNFLWSLLCTDVEQTYQTYQFWLYYTAFSLAGYDIH